MPDLSNGGTYFVTFTVTAWVDVFTRPIYKHIMIDSIRYCQEHKGLLLYSWCLMSNHIHMIAGSEGSPSLDQIIRDMKKFTSKQLSKAILDVSESRSEWITNLFRFRGRCHPKKIGSKFWKDEYDCYELFTDQVFEQKLNYIHENPVRAEIVEEAHHYLYSSARNYAGLPGLLDVIIA